MGLLVVVVGAALVRGRTWERYSPQVVGTDAGTGSVGGVASDGRAWIAAFALLVVAATAGTVLVLTSAGDATLLVLAGVALAVGGFLTGGTYLMARSRGHPHSHAVGEAIAMLGGVAILAVVANLVTSFGA